MPENKSQLNSLIVASFAQEMISPAGLLSRHQYDRMAALSHVSPCDPVPYFSANLQKATSIPLGRII